MHRFFLQKKNKGFTIFFATLVASLALAIGLGIYDVVVRQLSLSTTVSQSQYAIYAADSGAECALYWDAKYNGSSSAFPGSATPTSRKVVFLGAAVGSLQSWTVPSDWNNSNNTIEVIGGGGGGGGGSCAGLYTWGGGGGGGGAYSKISNLSLTPNSTVNWQVGAQGVGGGINQQGACSNGFNGTAGGNTWFNGASYGAASVAAAGGAQGLEPADIGGYFSGTYGGGGAGGNAASGIGTVRYSGGYGGSTFLTGGHQAGGGGGAAGPNGNGSYAQDAQGYGGASGYGGAGDAGAGGYGGGINANGGHGQEWGTNLGSGGGGGGGQGWYGGAGGVYGSGGGGGGANGGAGAAYPAGNGQQGLIMITYVSTTGSSTVPTSGITCGSYDMAAKGTPPVPFAAEPTGWTPWNIVATANAATTTFTLTFPGYPYCAVVQVGKVTSASGAVQTTIYSHGFNTCAGGTAQLEREFKVSY